MDAEHEFEYVLNILIPVLKKFERPLSVSYLNVQFQAHLRKKSAISERFMESFKQKFIFSALGDDVKIQLRDRCDPYSNEGSRKDIDNFEKILAKDVKSIESIKGSLDSEIEYEEFIKRYSSNKFSIGLSFVLRNSDVLQLSCNGEKTFVKLRDAHFEEISESKFWNLFEEKGLEKLVLERIINLFKKFKIFLNQGLLQSCFKVGDVLIDKKFMNRYEQYFDKKGDTEFILKEKYRNNVEVKPTVNSSMNVSINKSNNATDTESLVTKDVVSSEPLVRKELTSDESTIVKESLPKNEITHESINETHKATENPKRLQKEYVSKIEFDDESDDSSEATSSDIDSNNDDLLTDEDYDLQEYINTRETAKASPVNNFNKNNANHKSNILSGNEIETRKTSPVNDFVKINAKLEKNILSDNEMEIDKAFENENSIIIIGENFDEKKLFMNLKSLNIKEQRQILQRLKADIDEEICREHDELR